MSVDVVDGFQEQGQGQVPSSSREQFVGRVSAGVLAAAAAAAGGWVAPVAADRRDRRAGRQARMVERQKDNGRQVGRKART